MTSLKDIFDSIAFSHAERLSDFSSMLCEAELKLKNIKAEHANVVCDRFYPHKYLRREWREKSHCMQPLDENALRDALSDWRTRDDALAKMNKLKTDLPFVRLHLQEGMKIVTEYLISIAETPDMGETLAALEKKAARVLGTDEESVKVRKEYDDFKASYAAYEANLGDTLESIYTHTAVTEFFGGETCGQMAEKLDRLQKFAHAPATVNAPKSFGELLERGVQEKIVAGDRLRVVSRIGGNKP